MDASRGWLLAVVASHTACVMSGFGPGDCTSTPPASITADGGPRDAATAGYHYFQGVHAQAGTMLGVSAAVVVVQAPAGASVDARGVSWIPPAGAAGTTEPIRLRSDTDVCGDAAELAWTIRVHPAPEIQSFTATPPEASLAGTHVTLSAEYTGGDGLLVGPFVAPFPSGTTLDAGIVSSTTTFTLRVTSPAGDALDQALVVVAR